MDADERGSMTRPRLIEKPFTDLFRAGIERLPGDIISGTEVAAAKGEDKLPQWWKPSQVIDPET